MAEELRERVVKVLRETLKAFKEKNATALMNQSDMTLHFASIEQDPNSILIAVVVYSLAKVAERRKYHKAKDWGRFSRIVMKNLSEAKKSLQKDGWDNYAVYMKDILKNLGKLDHKFSKHIIEVIESAKIKKGTEVYRQGISVGRVADMMGISPWELLDYVGHTRITDVDPMLTKSARRRIKDARRIFNLI